MLLYSSDVFHSELVPIMSAAVSKASNSVDAKTNNDLIKLVTNMKMLPTSLGNVTKALLERLATMVLVDRHSH